MGLVRGILADWRGATGAGILLVLVFASAGADLIAWHDPLAQDATGRFLAPSWNHPFGTDEFRRDLFARTLVGLRSSLATAGLAVAAGAATGTGLGFLAGYSGGLAEKALMRFIDVWMAFPALLMAMAVLTIMGPGTAGLTLALALFNVPSFARLARAQLLSELGKDYVAAARAIGGSPARIMLRHIAPNAVAPLVTHLAIAATAAVLIGASLSFLGLGERPPTPTLGSLINASRSHLNEAWWYAAFPGAALALLLMSMNLLADALTDTLARYGS